jgi:hypothetical protein
MLLQCAAILFLSPTICNASSEPTIDMIKQQMLSKHNKTIKAPERMSLRVLYKEKWLQTVMEDKNITSAVLVLYMNVYVPSTHLVIFMDLILLFATYLVLKENNLQFVPSGSRKSARMVRSVLFSWRCLKPHIK